MKKLVYTATAFVVLACSFAATTSTRVINIAEKTKSTPTEPSTPDTNTTPRCPPGDPNGCGIYS